MVPQAAEESLDHGAVAEELVPLVVVEVRGDEGGFSVVSLFHEFEEDIALFGFEIEIPHFINEQEVESCEPLAEFRQADNLIWHFGHPEFHDVTLRVEHHDNVELARSAAERFLQRFGYAGDSGEYVSVPIPRETWGKFLACLDQHSDPSSALELLIVRRTHQCSSESFPPG